MNETFKNIQMQKFYMLIAEQYACLSKDKKTKVGALIVTQEGILYPGYNGTEIGGSNERDSLENGQSGFVHAEANAILKFNPTIHKDSHMYLTFNPCVVCARMIVNTQAISRVFYRNEYRETKGLDILKNSGIYIKQVKN